MDIPALSMALSQIETQSDVSMAVLAKSIDSAEEMGNGLNKIMEQSVTPYLGGNIDYSI